MQSPEMSSRAEEAEVRAVFVKRLERLIRLRQDYREDLNPVGLLLMDRAIDATYRDCLDYGATDQAKALISRRRKL